MHPSQEEPHMRLILLFSSCCSGFKTIAKTTETLNTKNTPEAKKANHFILMLKSEDTTTELKRSPQLEPNRKAAKTKGKEDANNFRSITTEMFEFQATILPCLNDANLTTTVERNQSSL